MSAVRWTSWRLPSSTSFKVIQWEIEISSAMKFRHTYLTVECNFLELYTLCYSPPQRYYFYIRCCLWWSRFVILGCPHYCNNFAAFCIICIEQLLFFHFGKTYCVYVFIHLRIPVLPKAFQWWELYWLILLRIYMYIL